MYAMRGNAMFELDQTARLEIAAPGHHVGLQTDEVIPTAPRFGKGVQQHAMV